MWTIVGRAWWDRQALGWHALVPKKYADLATSGLEGVVSKDKPTIDFELK